MKRVTLTFDVPDAVADRLIPCVGIYAVIHTKKGTVEVVDDMPGPQIHAEGTCGFLSVKNIDQDTS